MGNLTIKYIEENWPFKVTLENPVDKNGCVLRKRALSVPPKSVLLDIWYSPERQKRGEPPYNVGVPTTDLSGHIFNWLPDFSSAQVEFKKYINDKNLLDSISIGRRRKWERFLREHDRQ